MLFGFLFFACVTVSLKFLVLLFKNLLVSLETERKSGS